MDSVKILEVKGSEPVVISGDIETIALIAELIKIHEGDNGRARRTRIRKAKRQSLKTKASGTEEAGDLLISQIQKNSKTNGDEVTRVLEFSDGKEVRMSGDNTLIELVFSAVYQLYRLGDSVLLAVALLETADRLDTIRAEGCRITIFDHENGETEVCINSPSGEVAAIRNTQHAATLAAIAAYEAEFGEIKA